MPCTVDEVRADLSAEENRKYKDYQIQRWIDHKKGVKAEAVKTIRNQPSNEDRVKAILSEPIRRKTTVHELNRGVLNIVHLPHRNQVVVFINPRNKAKIFVEQDQADQLLLFMYYLQAQIETLIGDGRTADFVVDQMDGAMPTLGELKAQVKMFSAILGRSFPGIYSCLNVCCNWGGFFRTAISSFARGMGMNFAFLNPTDLMNEYGSAYVPNFLGGNLNMDDVKMGDLVEKFITSDSPSNRLFRVPQVENFAKTFGKSFRSRSFAMAMDDSPNNNSDFAIPYVETNISEGHEGRKDHKVVWGSLMSKMPLESSSISQIRVPKLRLQINEKEVVKLNNPVLMGTAIAIFGVFMTGSSILFALTSASLLAGWYISQKKLLTLLQEANRIPTPRGEDLTAKVVEQVLKKQLEQTHHLLRPMSMYVDIEKRQIKNRNEVQTAALAFASTLSNEEKEQLRQSIQLANDVLGIYPTATSTPVYKLWKDNITYLRTLTNTCVQCSCGCEGSGNMDFLEPHLFPGSVQRERVLQVLQEGMAPQLRKDDNLNSSQRHTVPMLDLRKSPSRMLVPVRSSELPLESPIDPIRRHTVHGKDYHNHRPPVIKSPSQASMVTDSNRSIGTASHRSSSTPITFNHDGSPIRKPEKPSKTCEMCNCTFSIRRRWHWCRKCLATICSNCTSVPLSQLRWKHPECVCKKCAEATPNYQNSFVSAEDAGLEWT